MSTIPEGSVVMFCSDRYKNWEDRQNHVFSQICTLRGRRPHKDANCDDTQCAESNPFLCTPPCSIVIQRSIGKIRTTAAPILP